MQARFEACDELAARPHNDKSDVLRRDPRLRASVCRVVPVDAVLQDVDPVETLRNRIPRGTLAETAGWIDEAASPDHRRLPVDRAALIEEASGRAVVREG